MNTAKNPSNRMAADFSFPDTAAKTAANLPQEFAPEKMSLSMGPSHPSTHGVLRLQMELDGEILTKCDPVVGYLHRGDEKIAENMTYNQFVPYTDRLDYLAPLANNMAYAIAVERLAKLEVPARCQAIRVITAELARVSSHLMAPRPMRCEEMRAISAVITRIAWQRAGTSRPASFSTAMA